jgi:hypothetical protein
MGLHGSRAVERVAAMVEPQGPRRWGGFAAVATLTMAQLLVTGVALVEFVAVAEAWLGMLGG